MVFLLLTLALVILCRCFCQYWTSLTPFISDWAERGTGSNLSSTPHHQHHHHPGLGLVFCGSRRLCQIKDQQIPLVFTEWMEFQNLTLALTWDGGLQHQCKTNSWFQEVFFQTASVHML